MGYLFIYYLWLHKYIQLYVCVYGEIYVHIDIDKGCF